MYGNLTTRHTFIVFYHIMSESSESTQTMNKVYFEMDLWSTSIQIHQIRQHYNICYCYINTTHTVYRKR